MTYISNKDFIIEVSKGNIAGHSLITKLGENPDTDVGSLPEDVWSVGGAYTGFPTGSPETLSIVSTDAGDTGDITVSGLLTSAATLITQETITLTGTTPVTSVNSFYRVHTSRYSSGTDTGFNIGTIQVKHSVTTANIFLEIPPGRSQSNMGGFTIPTGSTGYLINEFANVKDGGTSVDIDMSFWIRTSGGSPRLRRPISVSSTWLLQGVVRAPVRLFGGSDIIPRVTFASANNLTVNAGYDILLVED